MGSNTKHVNSAEVSVSQCNRRDRAALSPTAATEPTGREAFAANGPAKERSPFDLQDCGTFFEREILYNL